MVAAAGWLTVGVSGLALLRSSVDPEMVMVCLPVLGSILIVCVTG